MTFIIKLDLNRNKSKPFINISVYNKSSNFVKKPQSSTVSVLSYNSDCFLVYNSYFCFGDL